MIVVVFFYFTKCFLLLCSAEFWRVPSWYDVLAHSRLCGSVLLWSSQWISLHLSTVCACMCGVKPNIVLCIKKEGVRCI